MLYTLALLAVMNAAVPDGLVTPSLFRQIVAPGANVTETFVANTMGLYQEMMNSLTRISPWIALHWKSGAVVAGVVGIAATCRCCLETDEVRGQRLQRKTKKALRALADRISTYGRNVHHRYQPGT